MRRFKLLIADLILVAAGTFAAVILRENLDLSATKVAPLLVYGGVTLAAFVPFLLVLDTHRSVWRFTSMQDYLHVLVAVLGAVLVSVTLVFLFTRLEGVARSLPLIQLFTVSAALVGARAATRLHHDRRTRRATAGRGPVAALDAGPEAVLVVGWGPLVELYLRSTSDLAPGRFSVAGILSLQERHVGRTVLTTRVLGTVRNVRRVIDELEVHGVRVDRIVLATTFERLAEDARAELLEVERSSNIRIELLAERIGLTDGDGGGASPLAERNASPSAPSEGARFAIEGPDIEALLAKPYWRLKRAIDVVGAFVLIILTAPLAALTWLVTVFDVGWPTLFWQARPGYGGRTLRVYKFRTFRAPHDAAGNRVPDEARVTRFGPVLRRTRLDELPQLFQILIGQMSFVGPRPLLPVDQRPEYAARLLVRPGLTGWAQVRGGRIISAADKAALDIWYVQNASLRLDVQILLATAVMILRGETVDEAAVSRAWRDLIAAGICVLPAEGRRETGMTNAVAPTVQAQPRAA
jgi:lipopolysaccharide/colanic/teichoic acid biosynthesis glycosyltransferase